MPRKDGKDRGVFEKPPNSGRWYACWKGTDGRVHKKAVGSKSQARAYYERKRAESVAADLFPKVERSTLTVADLLDRYTEEWHMKSSASDDDRYARYWREYLGHMQAIEVKPGDIQRWCARRLKDDGVRGATVNRGVSFLRRIYSMALRDELFEIRNPASSRFVPKQPEQRRLEYLEEDDEPLLMASLTKAEHARMIEVAILTGMRASEQFGMQRHQVLWGSKVLVLPETKSRETRTLPLTDRLIELFTAQLKSHPSEFVWPGRTGESRQRHAMNRVLLRACERAKIRVISWHALRHTFGVRGVEHGDIHTVSQLMGHESLTTTEIYLHARAHRSRGLMDRMSAAAQARLDNPIPARTDNQVSAPTVPILAEVRKKRREMAVCSS